MKGRPGAVDMMFTGDGAARFFTVECQGAPRGRVMVIEQDGKAKKFGWRVDPEETRSAPYDPAPSLNAALRSVCGC